VQFEVTGATLSHHVVGTATPTMYGWIADSNTTRVPNGTYTLQSVAKDTVGNSSTSAGIAVTVDNLQTAVLIPSNGATLRGTAAVLDASASGPGDVTGVQFELTGGVLSHHVVGTAAPTMYGWIAESNTTQVPNGTYTLRSVATDSAGTVTSAPITITVSN